MKRGERWEGKVMKERRSTNTTTTNMRQHTRTTASWKGNAQGKKHTTHANKHANASHSTQNGKSGNKKK
jgi:hypothetical protein